MENDQLRNIQNNNIQPVAPVQPNTEQPIVPPEKPVVAAVQQTSTQTTLIESVPVAVQQVPTSEVPVQSVQEVEQSVSPQIRIENENKNEKKVVDTTFKNPDAFNNKEKVLYELKPEKEGNPIGVAIIFIILLAGLFMLPFADRWLNKPNQNPPAPAPIPTEEETNDDGLDDTFVFNSEQVSAGIGGLEFKNFVTEGTNNGYKIHFTIINNNESSYSYKKKYYMDFYEGENLIYHALIHSYKILAAKGSAELSLPISEKAYNKADSIKLVETKTTLYPKHEFLVTEGEYGLLTCRYYNSEIIYYFKNGLLEKIRETYNNKDYQSENYQSLKIEQQSIINKYQEVQGINANFIETETEFTSQIDFELANVKDSALTNLKVYRFFKYHEKGDIIAYEMPAMGYSCG